MRVTPEQIKDNGISRIYRAGLWEYFRLKDEEQGITDNFLLNYLKNNMSREQVYELLLITLERDDCTLADINKLAKKEGEQDD